MVVKTPNIRLASVIGIVIMVEPSGFVVLVPSVTFVHLVSLSPRRLLVCSRVKLAMPAGTVILMLVPLMAMPMGWQSCGGAGVTVTVNAQFALAPHWSVAVQLTTLTPKGNALPDGGVQVTVTGGAPPAVVTL